MRLRNQSPHEYSYTIPQKHASNPRIQETEAGINLSSRSARSTQQKVSQDCRVKLSIKRNCIVNLLYFVNVVPPSGCCGSSCHDFRLCQPERDEQAKSTFSSSSCLIFIYLFIYDLLSQQQKANQSSQHHMNPNTKYLTSHLQLYCLIHSCAIK